MEKSLIIIPTVRNAGVISDYFKNASLNKYPTNDLFFLILTEDHINKEAYRTELKENGLDGDVLNQSDRDKFMKENRIGDYIDIIPKKSHAETSFGLIYHLFHQEFQYGFFIDDDTAPTNSSNYFGDHIKNLNFTGEIESTSSNNGWVNVLYQTYKQHKLYPRGYPYSKMGEKISMKKTNIKIRGSVYISQGLWTNVPDLDAIRILMDGDLNGQAKTRLTPEHYKNNFIAERNNFITICSMNLAFRRNIIPAFYQFPMDDNPHHIGRFDDIWSGVVAKKVLDHINKYIINGFPLCIHNKAPRSTFKDILAESPGYESNEYFGESIKDIKSDSTDILDITEAIAQELSNNGKTPFIKYCGNYMKRWLNVCRKVGGNI